MTDRQLSLLDEPKPGPPPWRQFGPEYVHPPLARADGPQTSRDAAAVYIDEAEIQNGQITTCLQGMGPLVVTAEGLDGGGTFYQIAARLCWPDPVVVARRLAGLRQAGRIFTLDGTGRPGCGPEIRRAGRGHRPCAVHIAAEFVEDWMRHLARAA